MDATSALKRTPLYDLHVELGGKMVAFAGYALAVHYPSGIMKEHLHTRAAAGLFDVSHMGQRQLVGPDHATTAKALEAITPGDIVGLGSGRMRYTMLLNAEGGMVDDLMVTRMAEDGRLGLVFNGARKAVDDAYVRSRLPGAVKLLAFEDRALLALQGPKAGAALGRHCPQAEALSFMTASPAHFDGIACHISRSGYTGEDGFEIAVAAADAPAVARALLAEPEVLPIGLGARDSLRLEAGLCLYGHDIDETTSPVEANLVWTIAKRRKIDQDFPAAAKIMGQLFNGPSRRRVGLRLEGRAPAREGADIASREGQIIGRVTSGGFSPSLNAPIAMGYVTPAFAADGCDLDIMVRGKALAARVAPLPFVPNRYKR